MKPIFAIFTMISLALAFGTTGCHPRMAGNLLGAAIVTTAIVGTAVVLAQHDNHFHHEHCGCQRQYHEGQWVYYYNDGWEYHDHGVWYRYHHQPHYHQPHHHHHY